jgi:hypothetical protein
MCEGWTSDEVAADLDDRVRRHGWTLIGVADRDGGPTWTYTVGLADRDHPELLVANVKVDRATEVLADLATRVVGGERFGDARRTAYLDEAEATLRDVHPAHIGRGLVSGWESYYLWRNAPIPPLRVRQVVSAASCPTHWNGNGTPHPLPEG